MENTEIVWISENARLAFEELRSARDAISAAAEEEQSMEQGTYEAKCEALQQVKALSKRMVSLYRTYTEKV